MPAPRRSLQKTKWKQVQPYRERLRIFAWCSAAVSANHAQGADGRAVLGETCSKPWGKL